MQTRLVNWLQLVFSWSLIGLAFSSQLYLSRPQIGDPVSRKLALGHSLADWYVFGLLSLPATWLARRFPLEKQSWRARILLHLLAGAVFSVAWMIIRAWVEQWGSPGTRVSFAAAFSH